MSQITAASNTRKPLSKHATWAWMLWDWAEQPYPTIIQTFIFATYITSSYFGPNQAALSIQLGIAGAIAGLAVAVSAPVFGRRSDAAGHRKRWLLINSALLIAIMVASYLTPDVPLFGVSTANAENIRVLFLFSAAWMTVFTIPLALFVPEVEATNEIVARESIGASYRALFAQLGDLRRRSPDVLKYLIASAVYRDGLAGVFTYGAILGTQAFGFTKAQVIMFGIAANIVAGIGAGLGGIIDNRIGTKRTILISLIGMMVAGIGVFAFAGEGKITYWTLGLALCLFVGPAQASSRTFMARIAPDGREGELFGLYQTTGRAASFLSPSMWSISLAIAVACGAANAPIFGILGIMLVLGVGVALFMRVHPNPKIAE